MKDRECPQQASGVSVVVVVNAPHMLGGATLNLPIPFLFTPRFPSPLDLVSWSRTDDPVA